MPTAANVKAALRAKGNAARAKKLVSFFRAEPGGYAEGDQFFSVMVPEQREIAKQFRDLPIPEVVALLRDPYHECRLTALFILIHHFKRGDAETRSQLVEIYLKNIDRVNNWDLVDSSAHQILGNFLTDSADRSVLYDLAKTDHIWSQRVAIVATYAFIRKNDFDETIAISKILLNHEHDLIHKAVGWMLREMGKRDEGALVDFLSTRYQQMPRTMLRYAIEKFDRETRTAYLKGEA